MPDGEKADMGLTTTPEGAEPPQLHLTVYSEGPNAWKVRRQLTPAVEGTNESVYLAAGTYAIGRAWYPEYNMAGPIDREASGYAQIFEPSCPSSQDSRASASGAEAT